MISLFTWPFFSLDVSISSIAIGELKERSILIFKHNGIIVCYNNKAYETKEFLLKDTNSRLEFTLGNDKGQEEIDYFLE